MADPLAVARSHSSRHLGPRDDEPTGHLTGRDVADLVDATYRQIDFWCRRGYFGPHLDGLGSGGKRRFSPVDVEVAVALQQLSALGAHGDPMVDAARAVRACRVHAGGEQMLVPIDGSEPIRVRSGTGVTADAPAWMVRLIPFEGIG